jgi:hypothetical protein
MHVLPDIEWGLASLFERASSRNPARQKPKRTITSNTFERPEWTSLKSLSERSEHQQTANYGSHQASFPKAARSLL